MTEILLLGSFHFLQSNIDFYSVDIQRQLQSLVEKLKVFYPDKIAVEASALSQNYIDISYDKLCLSDFQNYDTIKKANLGQIKIYGQLMPITYDNEAIQIGYRLGKILHHQRIFAIDDDSQLEMIDTDSLDDTQKDKLDKLYHQINAFPENTSIIDLLKFHNTNEWSCKNHLSYLILNSINSGIAYEGAVYVSKWYERNLKIFANIQKLCNSSKRLFVIYGAGHLHVLRELINACDDMKLVDVYEYI